MAIFQVQYKSESLGVETDLVVIMPRKEFIDQGNVKTLYLLHGLSDNQNTWMNFTSIYRYVAYLPFAVIMPAVNRSFYRNNGRDAMYFDYITKEIPEFVQTYFPVSKKREDTFIAGLSMGGYGALKAGLTFPENYKAVFAFSGVLDPPTSFRTQGWVFDYKSIVPTVEEFENSEDNLYVLLEKQANRKEKPFLYVCCGTGDFLYYQQEPFVEKARELGFDVEYQTEEGTEHSWEYWDREIEKAIWKIMEMT